MESVNIWTDTGLIELPVVDDIKIFGHLFVVHGYWDGKKSYEEVDLYTVSDPMTGRAVVQNRVSIKRAKEDAQRMLKDKFSDAQAFKKAYARKVKEHCVIELPA